MQHIPYLVLIPLFVGIFAQILKFAINFLRKDFKWSYLNSYGGFPSAHSAFVTSLSTVALLAEGANSMAFAISTIMAALTLRDALGIRVFVSQHGYIINRLIRDFQKSNGSMNTGEYPVLEENLGHKIQEVLGGAVIGIGLSFLLFKLFV